MNDRNNTLNQDQAEHDSKSIFARLHGEAVSPSPFMKTRILARTVVGSRLDSRGLRFWRWMSAGLAVACLVLIVSNIMMMQNQVGPDDSAYVSQNYVINLDFKGTQSNLAHSVEVQLPNGVDFVSKNKNIVAMRSLKLPIPQGDGQSRRMPFVIKAQESGLKILKMKIYSEAGNLVEEREMAVRFDGQRSVQSI